MFTDSDLAILKTPDVTDQFAVLIANAHDVTLHSKVTGHDWLIVSNYSDPSCRIRHRHSSKDPFHEQYGSCETLGEALESIRSHDSWFIGRKKRSQEALLRRRQKRAALKDPG